MLSFLPATSAATLLPHRPKSTPAYSTRPPLLKAVATLWQYIAEAGTTLNAPSPDHSLSYRGDSSDNNLLTRQTVYTSA